MKQQVDSAEYVDRACPKCGKYLMQRVRESVIRRERSVWFIPFLTYPRVYKATMRDVCFGCGYEDGIINVSP